MAAKTCLACGNPVDIEGHCVVCELMNKPRVNPVKFLKWQFILSEVFAAAMLFCMVWAIIRQDFLIAAITAVGAYLDFRAAKKARANIKKAEEEDH